MPNICPLTREQRIAFDTFLNDYPITWGFDDICTGIETESDRITVAGDFTVVEPDELVKIITDLALRISHLKEGKI